MWDLSFPTSNGTCTLCPGRWSFNYWAAREIPEVLLWTHCSLPLSPKNGWSRFLRSHDFVWIGELRSFRSLLIRALNDGWLQFGCHLRGLRDTLTCFLPCLPFPLMRVRTLCQLLSDFPVNLSKKVHSICSPHNQWHEQYCSWHSPSQEGHDYTVLLSEDFW